MPYPTLKRGDPVRIADPKFDRSTVFHVNQVDGDVVEVHIGAGAIATLHRDQVRTVEPGVYRSTREQEELMRQAEQAKPADSARNENTAAKPRAARNKPAERPQAEVPSSGLYMGPMPIAQIDSSPLNPRKAFVQEELDALAASMAADGLMQPIVVKKVLHTGGGTLGGDRYEIVAGERRWRAAKQLGWTDIPAIVRDDVDDAAHLRLALLENLARSDLKVLEQAEGYRKLQELGMTQKAIAEATHRSQPAIANAVRLLELPDQVRAYIDEGRLTASHALALLRFKQAPKVISALAEITVKKLADGANIRSKDLEHGLPWEWELEQARAIKRLPWYDNPHEKVCAACPLNARIERACLRPDHWNELEDERRAQEKVEAERLAQRARAAAERAQVTTAAESHSPAPEGKGKAKSKDPLARLPQFDYSRHVELNGYRDRPSECTDACPCFAPQMRYRDKIVAACTDRHRYQALEGGETRKRNKINRARHKELLDELARQVDALDSIDSTDEARTWAILFDVIATQVGWKSHLRAAAERQDVVLKNYGEYDPADSSLYAFSGADVTRIVHRNSLEIAKLLIETIVRQDLEPMLTNGAEATRSRRAVAWLALDEIRVGDFVSVPGDPLLAGPEYRLEGYVVDRPTIASVIGKERARLTARLARLSYEPRTPGETTKVMLGGRCTVLVEHSSMVKVRPGERPTAERNEFDEVDDQPADLEMDEETEAALAAFVGVGA